jgi:hypothetical protein
MEKYPVQGNFTYINQKAPESGAFGNQSLRL